MEKSSFFKIDRNIFDNDIFLHPQKFRLFLLILGNARFADGEQKIGDVTIKKGQYLRSYRKLQDDLKFLDNNEVRTPSLGYVKRAIYQLVQEKRLEIEATRLGTLFTVCNYSYYQTSKYFKGSCEQTVNTPLEQTVNNNNNDNNDYNTNNKVYRFFEEVLIFWNKFGIIKHTQTNKSVKRAIKKIKTEKQKEELKTAIMRYAKAYKDKNFYYEHTWTLDKFIKQSNGYTDWLDEGQRWVEYKEKRGVIPFGRNKKGNGKTEKTLSEKADDFFRA